MRDNNFIFHDTWGRRWWRFKLLTAVAVVLVAVALAMFLVALIVPPPLDSPNSLENLRQQLRTFVRPALPVTEGGGDLALAALRAAKATAPGSQPLNSHHRNAREIRAAFFDPEDQASVAALRAHAGEITHMCPAWLRFTDTEEGLSENGDLPDMDLDSPPKLMPVLSNLRGDERVPEAVEALALAPDEEKKEFADQLADKLKRAGASGVVIDWQETEQGADRDLGALVSFLADAMRERGLETWLRVTLDATFDGWDFEGLAAHVDRFVALLHDEHGETDQPGPLASQDWFEGWLAVVSRSGNPGKWIASLACHGLDWKEGLASAEMISFADVMSRAGNAGCRDVRTDKPSHNGTFSYFYKGAAHDVWFLDAASFANQANAVRAFGLGGIALDDIGLEDPGIWRVLAADSPATPEMLDKHMPGGASLTSIGEGEVVNLDPTSFDGRRSFSASADGRISCLYEELPAHPTLFRMGGGDKNKVCLSFDDGPDPEWTPAILDILKSHGVKAAFFIVGSEAERYPEIVERIAAEGHSIGNHSYTHPNLAETPEALIKLELNATQRLVESLTGKSTTLFRPPYNADSHPSNPDELVPIQVAQSLGYMTVLENIDPCDWQEPSKGELLQRVKDARAKGNIILLHDGGGDRSATVEALPAILDWLEERGDKVVGLDELVSIDQKEIMPPVSREFASLHAVTSGAGFGIIRFLQRSFFAFLVVASILVLLRTILVVLLALAHRRRPTPPGGLCPPVSVIIPAFNEEKVIARTVRSMLDSDYAGPMEVIVIDDGSSDRTSEAVEAVADQRVLLLRQSNAGKSRALQNGVDQATGEIFVFADADTIFDPDAISHLVAGLGDPLVGAVSGQARVGNLRSFIARCQDLEYVCNFNLDRRAYASWNCITVVPGAISAIRREAIAAAGGFSPDTLAEDTDLTLAIHRAGYRIDYAPEALARTEAPETMSGLAKQRFRWAFGTLQCVWKHRDLVFNPRYKALGWFSLPGIWFFQMALVAISPLIDLLFLQALIMGHAMDILPYFLGFLLCDLALAVVAVAIEGMPLRVALRVIPQRFLYRPLLSYVVWRSLLQAMRGAWVGWNKLPRTASVSPA